MLCTPLLSLAHIMLLLCTQLSLSITRQASNSSIDCALHAVGDTSPEVVELTLGFLALTLEILLATFLFELLPDLSTSRGGNGRQHIPHSQEVPQAFPCHCLQFAASYLRCDLGRLW